MSRTDLGPSTIARHLRRMAGDGSVEWVMEPIQASVLLDIADMLEDNAKLQASNEVIAEDHAALCEQNAKLRELAGDVWHLFTEHGAVHPCDLPAVDAVRDRLRELGVEMD